MSFEEEERQHCVAAASALWDQVFEQAFGDEQEGVSEDMFADLLIRERALVREPLREQIEHAKRYLAGLFVSVAPQCTPLDSLLGVCTQIDNYLTGLPRSKAYREISDEKEAMRAKLAEIEALCDDPEITGSYINYLGHTVPREEVVPVDKLRKILGGEP